MKTPYITNAIIESVSLDDGGRDLLTGWVYLKFNSGGQGFGGNALYLPKTYTHHGGKNYAGHWIYRVMKIAEVTSWDKVPGKSVRVKKEDEWGKIIAIGHIVKDDWFDAEVEFNMLPGDK